MTEKLNKQILWFGVCLIIIFSPLWKGGARIMPLTVILLIAYSLTFMWLWRLNNNSNYKFKRTAIDIPIFLFAALAIISFFFSIYKYDSFYGLLKLFSYIAVYYLIVNEFDRVMIKRMLYVVIGVGAGLSIYGLLQYLNFFSHSWWDPKEFIAATFVNHNHFAGYLELVIPVAIGLAIRKSLKRRLLIIIALVIMTTVFILAQSRGAWASLGISFLVMIVLFARKRDGMMKNFLLLLLLLVVISSLAYFGRDIITERMSESISRASSDNSFGTRFLIWQGSIDVIRHNPIIGTGIGTFAYGFPRYRPAGLKGMANFAHNDYLETACDMGIPALIVMLWIIAVIIKRGLGRDSTSYYRLGCAIGVLSLSIHALSDFNFHIPANMLLFTIYSAIIMKARE